MVLNNNINIFFFLKCFKSPVGKVQPSLANTFHMLSIKHEAIITLICIFSTFQIKLWCLIFFFLSSLS